MGFFGRMIREGIEKGVSGAVSKAVQKAVEPAATNLANKAADSIDKAAQAVGDQVEETVKPDTSGWESALSNLQRSMEGYATEAAKNIKICPNCETACTAENKFCTKCGTKLPENTVAQGAVCPGCGKQNSVGTKFCSACGTKLPAAIEEEQAEAARGQEIMDRWDNELAAYPKWNCGGLPVDIQLTDVDTYIFIVDFKGNNGAAIQAVEAYRQLAQANGFKQAGEYPNKENLYKKINGICYHIDTEHCFDGDADCPTIGFDLREPYGGFDYVKPEPKKKASWKDLLGL